MESGPLTQARLKRSPLRSAVICRTDENGFTTTTVVYEKKRKRRISSRWRTLDKAGLQQNLWVVSDSGS